jgi:FMN phosphatase YigB (HAD superfamily)
MSSPLKAIFFDVDDTLYSTSEFRSSLAPVRSTP